MFGLGFTELLIVLSIFVILFGGKRLPEMAKALGQSFSEFKRELHTNDQAFSQNSNQLKGGTNELL